MGTIKKIQFSKHKYYAKEIVGKGQFGVLYRAKAKKRKKDDGTKIPKYVAVKEYFYTRFYDPSTQKNNCEDYFSREVKCTDLQSQYPGSQLKLIDSGKISTKSRKEYYIVLNFVEGKPLGEWFVDNYGKHAHLDEEEINQLVSDIVIPVARHLNFCHKHGLTHRDLSIDNVMIKEPRKGVAVPVIIDWGAAKLRPVNKLMHPPKDYIKNQRSSSTAFINKGTPPEIISGLPPLAASDIYMLGHIMYYLFSGGLSCKTPMVKDDYILHPKNENPSVEKKYDELVAKCTQYEPADRIENMEQILHVLEKMQEDFSPSRITYFGKPKSFAQQAADNQPVLKAKNKSINLREIGNGAIADQGVKPIRKSPYAQSAVPNQNGNGVASLPQANPKNPYISYKKTPTFVDKFNKQESQFSSSADPSSQQQTVQNVQNSVSSQQQQQKPVNVQQQYSVQNYQKSEPSEKQYSSKPSLHQDSYKFFVKNSVKQIAEGFLQYFKDPRWQYKRQDFMNYYWNLFDGVLKAYESKNTFARVSTVQENIYYVGRTVGSLDDTRIMLNYFRKVLNKAPETTIVFLGNFFSVNRFDVESFTMILSFKCLYPKNVVLLRGETETLESLKRDGLKSHLKFKFGGYSDHFYNQIRQLVSKLDLIHVAQLSENASAVATGGGIPFDPKNPKIPLSLDEVNKKIQPFHSSRKDVDSITNTLIMGRPNELANSSGKDSSGHYLFSWDQLQNFLRKNNLHYLFIPSNEKYGHRTLWDKISLLNSSSLQQNKEENQAKIVRLNLSGSTDFEVNDLKHAFQRDYN